MRMACLHYLSEAASSHFLLLLLLLALKLKLKILAVFIRLWFGFGLRVGTRYCLPGLRTRNSCRFRTTVYGFNFQLLVSSSSSWKGFFFLSCPINSSSFQTCTTNGENFLSGFFFHLVGVGEGIFFPFVFKEKVKAGYVKTKRTGWIFRGVIESLKVGYFGESKVCRLDILGSKDWKFEVVIQIYNSHLFVVHISRFYYPPRRLLYDKVRSI